MYINILGDVIPGLSLYLHGTNTCCIYMVPILVCRSIFWGDIIPAHYYYFVFGRVGIEILVSSLIYSGDIIPGLSLYLHSTNTSM